MSINKGIFFDTFCPQLMGREKQKGFSIFNSILENPTVDFLELGGFGNEVSALAFGAAVKFEDLEKSNTLQQWFDRNIKRNTFIK